MTFGEAKARLILHAVGFNDNENITTWEELEEKAGTVVQQFQSTLNLLYCERLKFLPV